MADFQARVNGLTGLSISGSSTAPSQDELSEFLKDGVLEVTNKIVTIKPEDQFNFIRESSTQATNGLDLGGANIISVIREAGVDGDTDGSIAWRDCRQIPISAQSRVVDEDSLLYASKYNPVYAKDTAGGINVYPIPGTDNGFRVFYVNNAPVDDTDAALIYSHSTIKYFPDDKIHIVVLYASCQALMAKLTSLNSSLPSDISLPVLPIAPVMDLSTTIINDFIPPSIFVPPALPADADIDFSSVPEAPVYIPPTISLVNAPVISELTITAIPPSPPVNPIITSPGVSTVTIDPLPTAPNYTAPVYSTAGAYLTEMEAGSISNADSMIDFETWWSIAGQLIEVQQDPELAAAQLSKLDTFLKAYNADMQNQLNLFNKDISEYTAIVSNNLEQARLDLQNTHKESDLDLQASIQDYTLELQKYQAELQSYQAVVSKEVQEYQQNIVGDIQVWQAERTTDLQKYGTDVQVETSRVANDMQIYQQEIAKLIQEYQAETGYDLNRYSAQVQAITSRFNSELQSNSTVFQNNIAELTAELQTLQQKNQEQLTLYGTNVQIYNAEVQSKVQEFTTSLQKDQADFQWASSQYAALKNQYNEALMSATLPSPQQTQQEAERQRR